MQSRKEYYDLLGFPADTKYETVTQDDIKKRYRKQALQFHPDKNKDPSAKEQFQKINEAYHYLSNLPIRDYTETYPEYGFAMPKSGDEDRKRKLNEAYRHVHGAGGFFNKALSFLAAFERICASFMTGLVLAPIIAAAGVILALPFALCALVAPNKLPFPFQGDAKSRILGALFFLFMLPVWGVLGGAAFALAAPIYAITTTPTVYKEYAVRGMNRKEKAQLFVGTVILTTFVLGFFPALGIAAAFGLASLNPSIFNAIFGISMQIGARVTAFFAGKLYDATKPCVEPHLAPSKQSTVAELEKLPRRRSTTANLLLGSPKAEASDVEPVPQQVADTSEVSSQVALNLLKRPSKEIAATTVVDSQPDSVRKLTA